MYELFSLEARNIMRLANSIARTLNHEYIGTEHVLLAIIGDKGNIACQTLNRIIVSTQAIREELDLIVTKGVAPLATKEENAIQADMLPITPRTKNAVIYLARQWANQYNSHRVEPEHLLLALLETTDGAAAQALKKCNITIESFQMALTELCPDKRMIPHNDEFRLELDALKITLEAYDISDLDALRRANQLVLAAKGIKLVLDVTIGEQPGELIDQASGNYI